MTDVADPVHASAQEFVGSLCPVVQADDVVNLAMIRQWCTALGDTNPVYLDEQAGVAAGFGGVIAPPAMLQAWIMGSVGSPTSERDSPLAQVYGVLDRAGCTSLVAVQSRQEYLAPLRLGDRVSSVRRIEAVSDRKSTPIGEGYFVSSSVSYRRQDATAIGRQEFRVFKFDPTGTARPAQTPRTTNAAEPDRAAGTALPPLDIDVDRTFIVATAIASHDWYPIHHDPDFARGRGLEDIIVNVLATTGLVGRYLTDWAGPTCALRSIGVRLGLPIYPGTRLRISGSSVPEAGQPSRHAVSAELASRHGTHVRAEAVVDRPAQ